MIYAGVEVSRKEGKKKLSVICIEKIRLSSKIRALPSGTLCQTPDNVGTRGNEGTERSGVHDEE